MIRHDPITWFNIWEEIIKECRELSRLQLAEKSGASLWTIKALSSSFTEYAAEIIYKNGKYSIFSDKVKPLYLTLSTLSEYDKEKLK